MLRQILADGIVSASEEPAEDAINLTKPETRTWTDLLFPFGIVLLILSLADISIRHLRWKDILMVFRRV